ncbi:MAG: hypothetical protein KBA26_14880, partial [Candidatus Delongbacteria bacterium]|nr:hypothetical protein [Candidatus Delongbacteria bacterium]
TFFRTQSAQLTISPEFTYCNACHHEMKGLQETCEQCGSCDVDGISRIVGYYSAIKNWNKSKKGELASRQKGNYRAEPQSAPDTGVGIIPPYRRSSVRPEAVRADSAVAAGKGDIVCSDGMCRLY